MTDTSADAAAVPWAIRPYQAGDEEGILTLFNRVFQEGNPDFVPRTMEQWRGQFEANPEGHDTFVATVDEDIVGQYTAVPARWRMPHGIHRGAQALDTCVAPEFRRSLKKTGLFLTLGREWFDHFAHADHDVIVYGFPNPQAFRIGTKRLDYRPVHCPVAEYAFPVETATTWRAPGITVRPIDSFDDSYGALDASLGEEFACVRDARYLNWRYRDNPFHTYRMWRAEGADGSLKGMLVTTRSWHGDRKELVPLVDWLVPPSDTATWRALLGEAARDGAVLGLTTMLAWAPPWHAHRHDLESLGFQASDSRFNLCIRIFTPEFDVEYAKAHWYVLMGDSDIY